MVGERIQSRRPFTSPMLELIITETPVPETDPEPLFPMSVIRSDDTVEAIEDDVMDVLEEFDELDGMLDGFSVSRDVSFTRGFGETRTFTILINASSVSPSTLDAIVSEMINEGYKFSSSTIV